MVLYHGSTGALQSRRDNSYLTVDMHDHQHIKDHAHNVGDTEIFTVDGDHHGVGLRSKATGKFVCVDNDSVHARDRDSRGDWETFTVEERGDGFFALKSRRNGKYLCAPGGNVVADRDNVGEWEQFRFVPSYGVPRSHHGQTWSLIAQSNHKFVCADGGHNWTLVNNRDSPGDWEKFQVEQVDGHHIALKNQGSGKYVVVDAGDHHNPVHARDRDSAGDWERFEVHNLPDGSFALKTWQGKFLSAGADGRISADKDHVGQFEQFKWHQS